MRLTREVCLAHHVHLDSIFLFGSVYVDMFRYLLLKNLVLKFIATKQSSYFAKVNSRKSWQKLLKNEVL